MTTNNPDFLNMSDEDFLNQPTPDFSVEDSNDESSQSGDEIESAETSAEDLPEDDTVETSSDDSEAQERPETEATDEEVSQPDGDTQTEHETDSDDEDSESLDTSDENETDTTGDTQETDTIDYESAYKAVMSPFKANGVEMQAKDPEEAIKLMQMGANYHKKMADLKPNLKIVKMLENHNLLDEGKLSHLIDLANKDPKAVAKLVADSGLDPLDIDTEGSKDYQPSDYSVSDQEYGISQALDNIKNTETFDRTVNVLTKEWDSASRESISKDANVIEIINEHMGSGVYDVVNSEIQKERAMGRLNNISDIDAYYQVAQALAQSGTLRQKNTGQSESAASSKDSSTVSGETEKQVEQQAKRKQKRKAMAPVKNSGGAQGKPSQKDVLNMSDEEFLKQFGQN